MLTLFRVMLKRDGKCYYFVEYADACNFANDEGFGNRIDSAMINPDNMSWTFEQITGEKYGG